MINRDNQMRLTIMNIFVDDATEMYLNSATDEFLDDLVSYDKVCSLGKEAEEEHFPDVVRNRMRASVRKILGMADRLTEKYYGQLPVRLTKDSSIPEKMAFHMKVILGKVYIYSIDMLKMIDDHEYMDETMMSYIKALYEFSECMNEYPHYIIKQYDPKASIKDITKMMLTELAVNQLSYNSLNMEWQNVRADLDLSDIMTLRQTLRETIAEHVTVFDETMINAKDLMERYMAYHDIDKTTVHDNRDYVDSVTNEMIGRLIKIKTDGGQDQ